MGTSASKDSKLKRLKIKFEEDTQLVRMSPKSTIQDVAVQAVRTYKNTTGKDVSIIGLKVSHQILTVISKIIRTLIYRTPMVTSWPTTSQLVKTAMTMKNSRQS